jgi:hypothetical protein
MSNNISTDRDSLVALDALLRIGRSRYSNTVETKRTQKDEKSAQSPPADSAQITCNSSMLLPLLNNNRRCSAAQLVAIHAANVAANFGNAFGGPAFSVHAAAADVFNMQADQLAGVVAEQNQKKCRAAEEAVRKEKVEAALRSKPQRGRRREDLSEKERLELTRTRNREHAKSTRYDSRLRSYSTQM